MTNEDERDGFRGLFATLWTLQDYLKDLTLIGGWVPELYKRFDGTRKWKSNLSWTIEADILIPHELATAGRKRIPVLLREAGYVSHGGDYLASVWTASSETGSMVELLVALNSPARQQSRPALIADQHDLGATILPENVSILSRHRRELIIREEHKGQPRRLPIHLPLVGAYVLNKVLAFQGRPNVTHGAQKRYKDLLYVRDIMAAGDEVVDQVAADMAMMSRTDVIIQTRSEQAQNILQSLADSGIVPVAEILAERDRTSHDSAMFDIKGHLRDLAELLEPN